MTIAVLQVRFRLPADTLKEKRSIVKSVVERVKQKYNAAVAEIEDLDSPGYATLGVACISNDARHADEQAQKIAAAIEAWRLDAELLSVEIELVTV